MTGDAVRFQSVPTALNVIYAAKKYMVRKIDDLALKFIYKNINSHNVLLVLQNVLMLQEEPEVLPSAPSLALLDQVEFKSKTDANARVCVITIQDKDTSKDTDELFCSGGEPLQQPGRARGRASLPGKRIVELVVIDYYHHHNMILKEKGRASWSGERYSFLI